MDKKVLFNEALTSLVEFAAAKGNEITTDDVKIHFKDLIDDESQYNFIYDYLAVNKIKVEGFVPTANVTLDADSSSESTMADETMPEETVPEVTSVTPESEEELSFIKMYMNEMKDIPAASEAEISELISSLLNNDLSVVDRLVECHLSIVAEIAETYRGRGVNFGDLIQEGNMGLMLAVSDYNAEEGDFKQFIRSRITNALEETVNSQINSDRIGDRLADKLNQLDTVTKNLSEKLGRVPDVKELAETMSISEEEVSLLLKMSLDTLSVNEDSQITEEGDSASESMDDISDYVSPKEDPLEWRVNKK